MRLYPARMVWLMTAIFRSERRTNIVTKEARSCPERSIIEDEYDAAFGQRGDAPAVALAALCDQPNEGSAWQGGYTPYEACLSYSKAAVMSRGVNLRLEA